MLFRSKRIIKLDDDLLQSGIRPWQSWLKYKTSSAFQSTLNTWDLVSLSEFADFDLMQFNRDELPEKFEENTGDEMLKIFKEYSKTRIETCLALQKKLASEVYFANDDIRKKAEQDDDNIFGKTMINGILKSLVQNGFSNMNNTTGYNSK